MKQKEKPQEKCWCEYPRGRRNNWNVSVRDKEGLPNFMWNIAYCPVCSKIMKED